jgi:hypothetical protein
MKIKVTVVESEFFSRNYVINCGEARQNIHWLASTSCLLFGQDHYPPGIYVPNLLSLKKDNSVPHPRKRIFETLEDGAEVVV